MESSRIELRDNESQDHPVGIEATSGETDPVHRQFGAVAMTVLLILLSCTVIVGATHWLWEMPLGFGTRQLVVCSFIGALVALPVLLSIWCTLGQPIWLIRIPIAIGTEILLLSVYLGAISMTDTNAPGEVYWLFIGVALAVTAAMQIPCWAIRIWGRVRIGRQGTISNSTDSQFSIKQLLITTTVVAATIPILQWLISMGEAQGSIGLPIGMICGFCAIFILVIGLLSMLSVCFVFLPRLRIWCALLLLVAWAGIPFAVLPPLVSILRGPSSTMDQIDMGLNIAAFSCAHSVALIVVFSSYYVLGFRIQKTTRAVT